MLCFLNVQVGTVGGGQWFWSRIHTMGAHQGGPTLSNRDDLRVGRGKGASVKHGLGSLTVAGRKASHR